MLAEPFKRLISYFFDIILSGLIMGVVGGILSAILTGISEEMAVLGMFLGALATIVVQAYFWSKSTSLGKNMLGMEVVKKDNEEGVGFLRMLIRETIGKAISGFIFSLGYIWILIDDSNQGWHDKFIGSVVVKNK